MEGLEIFNTQGMADAIRNTEYKNIYSAIAEIIDNSVEAKARNILIISHETISSFGKNGDKVVGDIAILDDGTGMHEELLHKCLVFGMSERSEKKSIGRFGVGLGQASMFASPRVEVFSWQNNSEKKMVYLDSDLMKSGEQKRIAPPDIANIPSVFKGFFKINIPDIGHFDFNKSGTMVLWKNVDKVTIKPQTFYKNLSEEIGRRFRYFINEGVRIVIITTQHSPRELVSSVDPLFCLEDSKYLANKKVLGTLTSNKIAGEPIFEPYISDISPNGECKINIHIENSKGKPIFSSVVLKCSYVKEKYYWNMAKILGNKKPGDTEIGKKLASFDNISVVRANREIQFEKSNFYNSTNEPENRWWAIELSFEPELDEFFKLSNNKQKIEVMSSYKTDKKEKVVDDSLEAQAWRLILDNFDRLKLHMSSRNKRLAQNAKKEIKDNSNNKDYKEIDLTSSYKSTDKFEKYAQKYSQENIEINTVFSKIEEYMDVDFINDDNIPLITIDQVNDKFKLMINEKHDLYVKVKENRNFIQGLNLFATVLANVRNDFNLYEEERVFIRIIDKVNDEFAFISEILGE